MPTLFTIDAVYNPREEASVAILIGDDANLRLCSLRRVMTRSAQVVV